MRLIEKYSKGLVEVNNMGERIKITAKKPLSTKENSASNKQKTGFRSQSSHVDRILFLQRTIGNQAVQRLIKSGALQAKLRIGQPGDVYEQEADRVADEVMRMPEPEMQRHVEPEEEEETLQTKLLANEITPLVQRQTIEEEEEEIQTKTLTKQTTPSGQGLGEVEEEEPIMTKYTQASADSIGNDLQIRLTQSRGSGQPMPERDRSFMERKFGADFSGVRVNTDSNAEQMNRELNARAFTHGRDIYFGASRYNPGTSSGKRLLAHELTHVVQQNNFMNVSDKINTGNLRAHELIHTIQKSNIFVPAIKTLEPIKNISKIQNWLIQREYVFIDAPVTVEPGRPPSPVRPATRCPLPSSITPCFHGNAHSYSVFSPNLQYRREADGSHVWWDDHFTETGTWYRSTYRYAPSTGICGMGGYPLSISPSSEPSPRPEEGEQTIESEALEPSVEAEELDTWYRNWRQIYNLINREEERVTLRSNEGVTYEVLDLRTTAQSLGPDGLPYYELYTFDLVNMETGNLQTINLLQIARRNFDTVYEVLDLQPIEEEEEEELRRQSEEEEEEELLQTKEISGHNAETTPNFESRINAIRGGGQPLGESERAFFEPRFGYDFSQVQVHTDVQAAEATQAVDARAFTVGQDVVFGAGQYAPGTSGGRRLLAHELTHVVQQNAEERNASIIQRDTTGEISITVPLIGQESTNTCWAAAVAMLVSLAYGPRGVSPRGVAVSAGFESQYSQNQALYRDYDTLRPLANFWEMVIETGLSPNSDLIRNRLQQNGPFITIIGTGPNSHAVVVRGISADNRNVYLADPNGGIYRTIGLANLSRPMTVIRFR